MTPERERYILAQTREADAQRLVVAAQQALDVAVARLYDAQLERHNAKQAIIAANRPRPHKLTLSGITPLTFVNNRSRHI